MHTITQVFSMAEKLAVAHAIDALIVADGRVHDREINTFAQLMQRIGFDSDLIVQARNISKEQAIAILGQMDDGKKQSLERILRLTAISDGHIHENETDLITYIFKAMGTTEI